MGAGGVGGEGIFLSRELHWLVFEKLHGEDEFSLVEFNHVILQFPAESGFCCCFDFFPCILCK